MASSSYMHVSRANQSHRYIDGDIDINDLNDDDIYTHLKLFGIVLYTRDEKFVYSNDRVLRFIFSHCSKGDMSINHTGQTQLGYFITTQLLKFVRIGEICDIERFHKRLLLFLLFGATLPAGTTIPLENYVHDNDDFMKLVKHLNELLFLSFGVFVPVNMEAHVENYIHNNDNFGVNFVKLLRYISHLLLKWKNCSQNVVSLKQQTLKRCFLSGINVEDAHPDMFCLYGINFKSCFNKSF